MANPNENDNTEGEPENTTSDISEEKLFEHFEIMKNMITTHKDKRGAETTLYLRLRTSCQRDISEFIGEVKVYGGKCHNNGHIVSDAYFITFDDKKEIFGITFNRSHEILELRVVYEYMDGRYTDVRENNITIAIG